MIERGDGRASVGGRLRDPGRNTGPPGHGSATGYCQLLIKEHGFEPEYATIRKGQALIWSPNLIHGGAVQTDKSKTRNSQVTHYFFEGCRYFGPMYSEPDHIVWEYPTWIREPPPARSNDEIREAIESSVPQGATVLIAGGDAALMDIADRETRPFPQQPDGTLLPIPQLEADAVRRLSDLVHRWRRVPGRPEITVRLVAVGRTGASDASRARAHAGPDRRGNRRYLRAVAAPETQ